MELLTRKYEKEISGVLGCFDRVVITGTLPQLCYSEGMTSYLTSNGIRIFDYPLFAEPFKEELRKNAEKIASENGIEIEFISKSHIRKEDIIQKRLEERGNQPGLVHIISAMESCPSYQPWHDKRTDKTYLKGKQGKCLHYYFYFIDEYLGLIYIRVPTWCPFKLQIYFNGHNILARELDNAGIPYTMIDNAFDSIGSFESAQELSDNLSIKKIHEKLNELAKKYCPIYEHFNQSYHWSIMQVEYSTDVVFKNQEKLHSIYSDLVSVAIHTVKPENIATFLGKKLDSRYTGEMGNNYHIRIEGSRIKHTMGKSSIKMYDKFNKILRIETTTNDVSFFKNYREIEHKDGSKTMGYAHLKKNIYSLNALKDLFKSSNQRYLEFISAIENKDIGRKNLDKITQSKKENERNYRGFNFFDTKDDSVLLALLRGEFNIYGFQNKDLKKLLSTFSREQISRLLKRLRVHGLIKKTTKAYKYYLTKLGKETILMAEKIKETLLIPALNF